MGTRAVVKCGYNFIGTHWDGYPNGLGQSLLRYLKREIRKKEIRYKERKYDYLFHTAIDKACWKAASDHNIDFASTLGEKEFNKIYGDYAEWYWTVEKAKHGKVIKIRVKDRGIQEWSGSPSKTELFATCRVSKKGKVTCKLSAKYKRKRKAYLKRIGRT